MRSPLELLRGQFDHALLTTYSFNLRFFEEWVLRSLWAAEVRNVVVFVDRSQLGAALLDREPTLAGRAYHLVSGSCAKHTFHPKLLLVSGREGARLCVSSANLTSDGQLRNAESAIAFDANLAGHRRPILEAGDLFRRLSTEAPPHTAGAIQAAVAALPEGDEEESPYRLLHNLDQRLLDSFPSSGRTRAIAPFVDASGTAARRLHERGELTVIVDGDEIAAAPEFFAAEWSVEARKFDARLHGKAYEVATAEDRDRWVLVGSPNLSQAALLQPAHAGNFEVAVAVTPAEELELPASKPWNEGAVADAAAARLAVARAATMDSSAPASFDAWEDADRIMVSGVPEGTPIERWSQRRWHPFGTVTDGAVLNPDPNLRPTRLRAVAEGGRVAFAVVTRPAALKARLYNRARGRQTKAVERLPLDVETVRILEEALAQLYTLSELAGEAPAGGRKPSTPNRDSAAAGELPDEWMPRTPEEEPRIPAVYEQSWEGEADALLALVRRVLRLDTAERPGGEVDVEREGLEIDELEEVTGEGEVERAEEEPPVRVGAGELERYRRAFRRLFERGEDFLSSSTDPTLAGWGFTYLMRLVEDLGSRGVEVDGQEESLMPRDELRAISLDLLERYLGRGEADPLCLATARAHLAVAIRDRVRYSSRDVERLEALAYEWAGELVSVPVDLPAPSPATIGMDVMTAISRLEDYAHRSQWDGVVGEAEGALDGVRLELEPWPVVAGSVSGLDRSRSPAWGLLGFAAPVGYAGLDPFGLVVENEGPGPVAVHVLICVPARKEIVEAWRRRRDGVWVERRYGAPTAGTVRRLEGLPANLSVTMAATERGETLEGSGELGELAARLEPSRAAWWRPSSSA